MFIVGNRNIYQCIAFFCCYRCGVTDLHHSIGIATSLMSDLYTYIDMIITDIGRSNSFFINFQTYEIIEVVLFFQFDRIFSVTFCTLHVGHKVRRIIIIYRRICCFSPGQVVGIIQLDNTCRISVCSPGIHFNPLVLRIKRNLCRIVAQRILVQRHIFEDWYGRMGTGPFNRNQSPTCYCFSVGIVLRNIPDSGSNVVSTSKFRIRRCQVFPFNIIGIDIDQKRIFSGRCNLICSRLVFPFIKRCLCVCWEYIIIHTQFASIVTSVRQLIVRRYIIPSATDVL